MKRLFFLFLLFQVFCNSFLFAGQQINAANKETEIIASETSLEPSVELPEPVVGEGFLTVTIESFSAKKLKGISQLAERVEIWLGDNRLAGKNFSSSDVKNEKNRRLFVFPKISLPHGYYFITAKCYAPGALYGRRKWHGETFQVGIHPNKETRIFRKISFFQW